MADGSATAVASGPFERPKAEVERPRLLLATMTIIMINQDDHDLEDR